MSDVQDQLATADEALTTAQKAVEQAVSDLSTQAPSVGDQVLDAIVPVLEAAGYTVTPPASATSIPVTDANSDIPSVGDVTSPTTDPSGNPL